MTKTLKCRDAGFECDHVARGNNEEELMEKVRSHAQSAHGVREMTPEMTTQVRSLVRDEQ
jgi:predicted small metal-binding protein